MVREEVARQQGGKVEGLVLTQFESFAFTCSLVNL